LGWLGKAGTQGTPAYSHEAQLREELLLGAQEELPYLRQGDLQGEQEGTLGCIHPR